MPENKSSRFSNDLDERLNLNLSIFEAYYDSSDKAAVLRSHTSNRGRGDLDKEKLDKTLQAMLGEKAYKDSSQDSNFHLPPSFFPTEFNKKIQSLNANKSIDRADIAVTSDEISSNSFNDEPQKSAEELADQYLLKIYGRLETHAGRKIADDLMKGNGEDSAGKFNIEDLHSNLSKDLNKEDFKKIFPEEEAAEFIAASYIHGPSLADRLTSTDLSDTLNNVKNEYKPDIIDQIIDKAFEVKNKFGEDFKRDLYDAHKDEDGIIDFNELNNSLDFVLKEDRPPVETTSRGQTRPKKPIAAIADVQVPKDTDVDLRSVDKRAVGKSLSEQISPDILSSGGDQNLDQTHYTLKKLLTPHSSQKLFDSEKAIKVANNDHYNSADTLQVNAAPTASKNFGQSARDPSTRGAPNWSTATNRADASDVSTVRASNRSDDDASTAAPQRNDRIIEEDIPRNISGPTPVAQAQRTNSAPPASAAQSNVEETKKNPSLLARLRSGLNATATGIQDVGQRAYAFLNSLGPAPKKPEVPEYVRIPTSREVDAGVNAKIFEDASKRGVNANSVEVGKLRIPGVFTGTQTIDKDGSVTYERQALGGAFKRTQVYKADNDGTMLKRAETKENLYRTSTDKIEKNAKGEMIRTESRKNLFGASDTLEHNANGRLLTQKANLAYNMTIQAHPQAELNPNIRQKTTAVLGMFKGTFDVGANNKAVQTGYSNPFNSNETIKIANGGTKNRQTDLGGLLSRTVETAANGSEFVTKDRARGFYKMQATQARAPDGNGKGTDAKTTVEAGFLGIKAFKREVVIPHDADLKTTTTKVFGVTVRKQISALSDEEKNLRDVQVNASKPKAQAQPKNFLDRTYDDARNVANFAVRNPGTVAAAGLSVTAAAINLNPLTLTGLGIQGAALSNSYRNHTAQHGPQSQPPASKPANSIQANESWGTGILKATTTTFNAAKEAVGNGLSAAKSALTAVPAPQPANTRDDRSRSASRLSI